MQQQQETCFLCGKELKYDPSNVRASASGLPLHAGYGHDPDAKTEMHVGHVRERGGRKEFRGLQKETWQAVGIDNPRESIRACYECHEVVMHNPVLSKAHLELLAKQFSGKTFSEKVIALNKIFVAGLASFNQES